MSGLERNILSRKGRKAVELREPFKETSYGIVKRTRVIEEWVDRVKKRREKSRLTILDYGCGTGDYITFPLAVAGHEVLGIDIHEPSIREAQRKYTLPNLSFRAGEIQDFRDEDLSFDLIVCSEVLEHLHNPSDFLAGLSPLIRPGGGLIVTTPNGYGSFEMLTRLERALSRIGVHQAVRWVFWQGRKLTRRAQGLPIPCTPLEDMAGDQHPGFLDQNSVHVQFFRVQTLEKLFSDAGFHVVARRARTLFCGPYVDVVFGLWPWRQPLIQLNNRLADMLPFKLGGGLDVPA